MEIFEIHQQMNKTFAAKRHFSINVPKKGKLTFLVMLEDSFFSKFSDFPT